MLTSVHPDVLVGFGALHAGMTPSDAMAAAKQAVIDAGVPEDQFSTY